MCCLDNSSCNEHPLTLVLHSRTSNLISFGMGQVGGHVQAQVLVLIGFPLQ